MARAKGETNPPSVFLLPRMPFWLPLKAAGYLQRRATCHTLSRCSKVRVFVSLRLASWHHSVPNKIYLTWHRLRDRWSARKGNFFHLVTNKVVMHLPDHAQKTSMWRSRFFVFPAVMSFGCWKWMSAVGILAALFFLMSPLILLLLPPPFIAHFHHSFCCESVAVFV